MKRGLRGYKFAIKEKLRAVELCGQIGVLIFKYSFRSCGDVGGSVVYKTCSEDESSK